ncbi:uncharacterized protein PAC_15441 [Phialocephala subalpina]|uniref:Uncharacterized protein n=1 Tax=Phialocephala subalpina TaxID=576137 RepID=A0A1L7XKG0_9HELO|nr:uncharacterized protein PAC_15441 [Phialocephala subalpina]
MPCLAKLKLSNWQISVNTRPHLLTQAQPRREPPIDQPKGRTGLYYRACMSSYRPKFICAEPTCRRPIKPVYDPDKFEYRISEFQDWAVRTLEERSPGLAAAYRNSNRMNSGSNRGSDELATLIRLQQKQWDNPASISEEEFEFLKARDPQLWWTEITRMPRISGVPEINMVRCPGCGKGVKRVGSNFRVPRKRDQTAWKAIEEMIERGEDMVAKFSFCATVEEHERMVKIAIELRSKVR